MLLARRRNARPTALLVAASLAFPLCLVGCGGKGADTTSVPPPVDDTRGGATRTVPTPPVQPAHTGMSTGKKAVVVLAGAALLYYLYKHHEKAKEMAGGQDVQYYQSKNGRIYYRDPQTHQAHWVTPPSVELTEEEAQEAKRYKGYNNSTGGEDYTGASQDTGPAPQ